MSICPSSIKKKDKVILVMLGILLNLILRIPSVPHEIGGDTFQIHVLANSLLEYGEARWWLDSLSVFGMYAYSYASSVPFSVANVIALTGLDSELAVLLFSITIGVFSFFSSYLFSSTIFKNFTARYIFSIFYSISLGVLQFTLWNTSARGLFLVMFPLSIYLILQKNSPILKKAFLLILVLIFLRATHNFVYFTFLSVVMFILVSYLYKVKILSKKYLAHIYVTIFLLMFIFLFISKPFTAGSRYGSFIGLIITTVRYVGPTFLFVIPGFIYLILKDEKTMYDWFILASVLFLLPIFFSPTYGKFVTLVFIVFFATVGVKNITMITSINKKYISVVLVLIVLSLTVFSSFYSHYRTGSSDDFFYMAAETGSAGLWTKEYIEMDTNVFPLGIEIWRMMAISEGHVKFPTIPPVALTYGFVENPSNNTISVSPFSLTFYFEGAYVQKQGTSSWGEFSWYSLFDITDKRVQDFIAKYDLKYLVRDKYVTEAIMGSMSDINNRIYDNGRVEIWRI